METYSPYFETIYESDEGSTDLGRGTHYSILRAKVTNQTKLAFTGESVLYYDFGLIWDEDHDTRVIEVLEKLYETEMIFDLQFVGERKGYFSAVMRQSVLFCRNDVWLESFESNLQEFLNDVGGDPTQEQWGDSWGCDVSHISSPNNGIIHDHADSVTEYLQSIQDHWRLGFKSQKVIDA